MDHSGGIYFIIAPSGSIYVGSTNNFVQRKRQHFSSLKLGNHHCMALQRAYLKYGDALMFHIIERLPNSRLIEREQFWIDNGKIISRTLYNSSGIAGRVEFTPEMRKQVSERRKGMKFTDQHRENLRLSHVGKPSLNKGKSFGPATIERKQKVSASLKGVPKSEEHKENLRKLHLGRKVSDESKQRMRAAQRKWRSEKKTLS